MANSKRKGKHGELEAVKVVRQWGLKHARRSQQYAGTEGHADLANTGKLHIEVKRGRKTNIKAALQQAQEQAKPNHIPVALTRDDHKQWIVSIHANDLKQFVLECYRLIENGAGEVGVD